MPQAVGTGRRGGGSLLQPSHCLMGLRADLPSFSPWGFGFLLLPVSRRTRSQNKYCTIFLWKTQGISAVSQSYPAEQPISAQGHTDLEGPVERQDGTPSLGCCLLTTGSDHTLTQKNKRQFTSHLELGLSHKFKYE